MGIWIGKAVILVKNYGLDLSGAAISLQHFVEGNREVAKGWDGVVRQTDAWLEEYPEDIE